MGARMWLSHTSPISSFCTCHLIRSIINRLLAPLGNQWKLHYRSEGEVQGISTPCTNDMIWCASVLPLVAYPGTWLPSSGLSRAVLNSPSPGTKLRPMVHGVPGYGYYG
eukprot:3802039-Rhodomonas_salina.2